MSVSTVSRSRRRALEASLRDRGAKEHHEVQESIIFRDTAADLKKDTLLRLRTVDGRRELTS